MRCALLFSVAIFSCISAFPYGYHHFVKQGKVWHCQSGTNGTDKINMDFTIEGDTVVNNVIYQKVYRTDSVGAEHSTKHYDFAVREDKHVIYRLDQDSTTERLLYDFELGVTRNDVMLTDHWMLIAELLVLYRPGDIMLRSYYCYPYFIDSPIQPSATLSYVEGIGNPESVFSDPMSASGPILQSCYEGDVLLYSRDNMFNYIMRPNGDITNDGDTDISDINAAISMMLGKDMQPAWDDVAADLDNSLNIDIADVNAVINAMLGKER
ncbi:MAG: hypothetical protein IJ724_04545 [Muribaculaceae bacterium]|nr:hypothetical protein [Muribaculaceae bacterium]MBR1725909.1 hypothetical protein [Muribaculaceae bacterium]